MSAFTNKLSKFALACWIHACRSLILQNKDFYMDLINTAGDDAYELKKSLRNLIQKDSDPQLVKFVNSIDSVPEVETA